MLEFSVFKFPTKHRFVLQATASLCSGDVQQRNILVQDLHHSAGLGHQVHTGLQPFLVLQRRRREGVPHSEP